MRGRYRALVALGVFLIINVVGALILSQLEHMDATDSFYLAMSTTTLAGHFPAHTKEGKWFVSFFQLAGFGLFFYMVSLVATPRTPW